MKNQPKRMNKYHEFNKIEMKNGKSLVTERNRNDRKKLLVLISSREDQNVVRIHKKL